MFDETAARLAALAATLRDAVITTDLDSVVTMWNSGAERLFGYPATEVIGRSLLAIVTGDEIAEESAILGRVRKLDTVRDLDTVRRRRDGSQVSVLLTVAPIVGDSGAAIGTVRILRDANENRVDRAARWLAAIVESSDDAIISKDLDGIVNSWNRAAERMFGYTAVEMIGRSIRTIIPADRQAEEDHVLASIRRGQKVDHFETIRRRKDGSEVPISLTVSPMFGADGTVMGASKIARDITERRRLAEAEQEANRLKDEFLATLSHELRTPLNAILGYAKMIRTGIVPPERQPAALETIERNARSLTQIVEDVLDISRIDSGKMRLNVQPLDLAELVRNAVDALVPAADAKGISVDIDIEPIEPTFPGDPERLQQVLWNLMSNAVKFTDGGGSVRVSMKRVNSRVEITVSDTGIGISPAFLPHIFERFRQADAATTRERGGLGLGLSIARQLVELHGGTIRATSEGVGKGTTFCVTLPLMARRDKPPAGARGDGSAAPYADTAMPDLHGIRVLSVDDDPDALAMVRQILEAAGADVICAESAAQALEALSRQRPDVLVTDLAMPRVDGFGLLGALRQHSDPEVRQIPTIALTAYARSEDRMRALRSGFQTHLSKPLDPMELMNAVASVARRAMHYPKA